MTTRYKEEGKNREKVTPNKKRKQSQVTQRKAREKSKKKSADQLIIEILRSNKKSKPEQKGRRIWKKVGEKKGKE